MDEEKTVTESKKKKSPGILSKAKFLAIGIVIGLVIGVVGLMAIQNHNPKDETPGLTASVVFERIASQNELVSASQKYSIVEKVTDTVRFFDMFDLPFTTNSFWYRYVGEIKAGVDLSKAEYSQQGNTITVKLKNPYIISNTPNMEESGVLEENNNVLNMISIEQVDAFRAQCIEKSESEAIEGGLMDEARHYAETNLRSMFGAALGDAYTVEIAWTE